MMPYSHAYDSDISASVRLIVRIDWHSSHKIRRTANFLFYIINMLSPFKILIKENTTKLYDCLPLEGMYTKF